MENTNPNACSAMEGGLPGKCANLAFPYIAMQGMNAERYDQAQALAAGGVEVRERREDNGWYAFTCQ